jgi:hypothetical protein
MEVHVLVRGQVPSKAALARTLRELGFPFTIPNAKGSLAQQSGFMPMKLLRRRPASNSTCLQKTSSMT